jgi:glucokinase
MIALEEGTVRQLAAGVDIGGTHMRAALIDRSGRILARRKGSKPGKPGLAGVDEISALVRGLVTAQGLRSRELLGVGVGIPGWVDRITGKFVFAPKLAEWQQLPVLARLKEQLGCPVALETDPRVATLGELWLGAGRGKRDFVLVTVGTGIGCGIVMDGRLCVGHHGFGAELGHTVVDLSLAKASVPRCACGTPGCLESLASGPAMAQAGQDAAAAGDSPHLVSLADGMPERISAEMVVAAARQGDIVARGIITQAGEWLGVGIANVVSILEPELVAIGGGLSEVGELFLVPVRQAMRRWCYLIGKGYIDVDLVQGELGDDAGIVGAAKMALDDAEDQRLRNATVA